MKKILLFLSLVTLSLVSLSSFAWKVIRENDVVLYYPVNTSCRYMLCEPASFLVTRHSVTAEQPFDITEDNFLPSGIPHYWYDYSGNTWGRVEFSVFSGRHKSATVLNDIIQWGYGLSNRTGLNIPAEMNFAVEGTLTITPAPGQKFSCKNIVLAQTGKALENPWYIFSKQGYGMYHGRMFTDVACSTKEGYQQYFRIYAASDSNYAFDMIPVSHPNTAATLPSFPPGEIQSTLKK